MSLNSDDKMAGGGSGGAGAAAAAHLQAPRLQTGGVGYATWKPSMDVYLQRTGADGIHRKPLSEAAWVAMVARDEAWKQEAFEAALLLAIGAPKAADGSAAATGSGDKKPASAAMEPLSAELKEARKLVSATVERSHRAFGALFSALPEELRLQVAHLPQGWANGLWLWLEAKFQSTEEDSVGELLSQWTTLQQDADESFDAYRARVNKLNVLLEQAKEKPSARMYTFMLLDRLQPRYKAAVLALKAGGQLKDTEKVQWDSVTSFINAHERTEARLDREENPRSAMAAARTNRISYKDKLHPQAGASSTAPDWVKVKSGGSLSSSGGSTAHQDSRPSGGRSPSPGTHRGRYGSGTGGRVRGGGRDRAPLQCFVCDELGHMSHDCPLKPKKAAAATSGNLKSVKFRDQGHSAGSGNTGGSGIMKTTASALSNNRFEVISDSESDSEVNLGSQDDEKSASIRVGPALSLDCQSANSVTELTWKVKPVTSKKSRKLAKNGKAAASAHGSLSESSWGIDSMASVHLTSNRALFHSLRRAPRPVMVEVANGALITTRQYGTVKLRMKVAGTNDIVTLAIKDVYYHPSFSLNLLSWNMLREQGWRMTSDKKLTVLSTPGGNTLTLNTSGRISVLDNCAVLANPTSGSESEVQPEQRVCGALTGTMNSTKVKDLVRLHELLGHCSFSRMVRMIRYGRTLHLGCLNVSKEVLEEAQERITHCVACSAGKARRPNFGHRGLDRGQAKGEVLHMDTFQVRYTKEGQLQVEHGLTISDPYTKWRWVHWLASKDQVAQAVKSTVRQVQTQLGCKVKRLYADGGSEFINHPLKSFCEQEGIELHWSPARTQQLNGIAESDVRSTKDDMRTLMTQAGLPPQFWWRAAYHSVYIWNRTALSSRTNGTPYEAMYGKKPSIERWGIFGCDALVHVPKEQRGASLAPKSEPGVYLGHDSTQNCAVVLLLSTRKTIETRDVKFRLGSFAYASALSLGDDAIREVLESPSGGADFVNRLQLDVDSSVQPEDEARLQGGSAASEESDKEYEVESIIGRRKQRGRPEEYQVRWVGYEKATWEPARDIERQVPELVSSFQTAQDRAARNFEPRVTRAKAAARAAPADADREAPVEAFVSLPAVLPVEQLQSGPQQVLGPADPDSIADEVLELEPRDVMVQRAMSAIALRSPMDRSSMTDRQLACAVKAGTAMLEQRTPATFREAMDSPDAAQWRTAMDKEMASCEELKVWDLVPRSSVPKGKVILPPKWVYKIKIDESGEVAMFKARVTPKGFKQKEGSDYFEVFAATGSYKAMRLSLSLAAKWDHELEQLDVPTAFLNADVEEELYMALPEGYSQLSESGEPMVCRLKKSLYGLKQAPRNWYILVSCFLVMELGFKESISAPCLFWKRTKTGRLILLYLFVDDFKGNFHREDRAEWAEIKEKLHARFKTKDLGESKWILGMRIQRDRRLRTIKLDQELYITKALEKYGLAQCKTADTPEVVGAAHQDPTPAQAQPCDRQRFMEITGTLMYAAISTRPDIAHAVHYLASHMSAPTVQHMDAATRVLRYCAGTRDLGLVFGSRNNGVLGDSRGRQQLPIDICAYSDADWANNKADRKSITGWVAKLNGDPVSWSSKKQRTVALSTCEAELYAKAAAIQEVLWMRGLMKELGLHTSARSVVHGDNQSAIAVSKNGIKGERTKHVDIKYHFITESIENGQVQLQWVPTLEQEADIFTKALPAPAFHQFRRQLMSQ